MRVKLLTTIALIAVLVAGGGLAMAQYKAKGPVHEVQAEDMAKVLQNQEAILRNLEYIKAELKVIKIRGSR